MNGIKIMNINGAEVLKLTEGRYGDIKYNCVISNSLLLDKLKTIGLKPSKQNTTKDIINVKFDYGYKSLIYKEYEEKLHKKKQEIKDCIDKEKLVKLKEEKKVILNKLKEENMTKKDIRKELYNNGFNLDTYKKLKGERTFDKTVHYVFWFRTAGKAKNGNCYFINEKLFKKIDKWQRMGIKLPKENAKLVEMEVYKSLVSSALVTEGEKYFICDPDEILVVNDLDSYGDLQNIVEVKRDEETGESIAIHTKKKCKNTIWDGMALIQGGEGFRGLRHHMYKTGAFCSDFQQFFKDYYKENYEGAYIKDRYGRNVKVSTIRMITTENAMKWEKFLGSTKEAFEQWAEYVRENGCKFGICKSNHSSKYGSKQRMSYQMVNTLPLNDGDIPEIFNDSREFVKKLQNDDKFFIEHLKRTSSEVNNNMLLADLAEHYETFTNSFYFKSNRKAEINKYKNSLKNGKILAEGDNLTVCGNPMLLLKYVVGDLDKYIKDGVIEGYIDETLPNKNNCFTLRFKEGEELGAFRSPHNSMNNIGYHVNTLNEDMIKYFSNFGNNVMAVNCINNDEQDRKNGQDFDTDFNFVTNNKTIAKSCKKAQLYPTIVNSFKKSTKKYRNTMDDLTTIDDGLQCSQKAIGTSSNVAMLYLTNYWDKLYRNNWIENEETKQMLDNVCILSVLAQVAVDSSKRAFIVGNGKNGLNNEIERLRKKLPRKNITDKKSIIEKPTFWQYTNIAFNNSEIEKRLKNEDSELWKELSDDDKKLKVKSTKKEMIAELKDYYCPVNNILKEIDKLGKADYNNTIDDYEFLVKDIDNPDKKQSRKMESIVYELDKKIKIARNELDEDDLLNYCNVLYEEYIKNIKKYKISQSTMLLMIQRVLRNDNKIIRNNRDIKTIILNLLYKRSYDNFIKCFKNA